ncbi:hypothetical protein SAMN02910456_02459 [Ruminococcaceae bacterium YRB3002]|nr:hypothetical protein SAMN02910456_02459 [Ruminococcaceae bacterium YRB3002]
MSIYALSDLHLSLSHPEKSMCVFGSGWDDYIGRIRENWLATVKEDDTVLVAGDISWATKITDAVEDFGFISDLPGTKLLCRGNHDYWWTTISKMEGFMEEHGFGNIRFVRTNVIEAEGVLISGTRGWMLPSDREFTEEDRKIYDRELARLRLCFAEMDKADPGRTRQRIIMLHYPPVTTVQRDTDFVKIISEGGAGICVYGHLHGRAHRMIPADMEADGCRYYCISGDYLGFKPILLTS